MDWSTISGLLGAAMQIYSTHAQNARQRQIEDEQRADYQRLLSLTPEKVSAGVKSLEQPISADLQDLMTRMVGENLASRGVTGGGFLARGIADALAPYAQESQKMALEAYFKMLGLPSSARIPIPQTASISGNPFQFVAQQEYSKALKQQQDQLEQEKLLAWLKANGGADVFGFNYSPSGYTSPFTTGSGGDNFMTE